MGRKISEWLKSCNTINSTSKIPAPPNKPRGTESHSSAKKRHPEITNSIMIRSNTIPTRDSTKRPAAKFTKSCVWPNFRSSMLNSTYFLNSRLSSLRYSFIDTIYANLIISSQGLLSPSVLTFQFFPELSLPLSKPFLLKQ